MTKSAIVDFSHLANLPAGNDDQALTIRELALGEAIAVVISEAKKHGFDYCDVISALGHHAHTENMKTVELWLEGAYSEASTYGEHRATKEAFRDVFLRVHGEICVDGEDFRLLSPVQVLRAISPTAK